MSHQKEIYVNDVFSPCPRRRSKMSLTTPVCTAENCNISDVEILDDVILVADSANYVIKAFSMFGDYLSSSVAFNAVGIFGDEDVAVIQDVDFFGQMTVLDRNSFAIAVPGLKAFAVLMLTPENEFVKRWTKTRCFHSYRGLARYDNQYIACANKFVDVMSATFEVIGRLTSEYEFENASCVAVSRNGNIVICDTKKQCIVVISRGGYILTHLHLGMTSLQGLTTDGENILFVTSESNDLTYYSTRNETMNIVTLDFPQNRVNGHVALRYLGNGDVIIAEKNGSVKMYHVDRYDEAAGSWFTKWRKLKLVLVSSIVWKEAFQTVGLRGFVELVTVLLRWNSI